MELLLENGIIVDGTGTPPRAASILVRDGRIAEIDSLGREKPDVPVLDCSGHLIAPGFVDVHTHSDHEILEHRTNKVLQGVTTEIVGNCGYSLFPMHPDPARLKAGSIFEDLPRRQMLSAQDYYSAVEKAKPLVNVSSLTGHSALRSYAMGMDKRVPTPDEMKDMLHLLQQSLAEGSIGFSTGLNCLPSSFAGFDELVSLCRVLKPYGAYYTTHMRDYKSHVVEAVEEAIRLAEEADVPVQLSHVQVVGKKNWHHLDAILALVDSAHRRGLNIGIDAYPYLAGSCSLIQFLPEWAQDGGLDGLLNRLASPSDRDKIAHETEDLIPNTWADIVVCGVNSELSRPLLGKSIEEIAADRGCQPRETAVNLLHEEEGNLFIISFNNCDENLRKVMCHPLASVGSDSFVQDGISHPRTFGTYPLFLAKYVRDLRWMSIEQAIVKTSAMPAQRFNLKGRGSIAVGNWADLVVFDFEKIGTRGDYAHPFEAPEGIRYVLVNGEIAAQEGAVKETGSGKVLYHSTRA